jgi:predicted transcriptional regulator
VARDKGAEPADERAPRRGAGQLESAVLEVLWAAGEPLSPGEVRNRLPLGEGGGLAYSTVVTILSRLHEKGTLRRTRDGRAFRYTPVADEPGLAARRLSAMLDLAPDREAVLSRFVEDLSDGDEALLRTLLGERADRGGAV